MLNKKVLDRYEKGGHLSQTRHDLAANRYKTIGQLLCARESPFADQDPEVYPQGSMRLGTTVRPLDGPSDLDFVRQLSLPYFAVDPMALLTQLFTFFKANERYKDMVERKNRCVRFNNADDFYIDILPACRDTAAGLTCIRVPDRAMKGWKGSNPIGYTDWFQQRSRYRRYKFARHEICSLFQISKEQRRKKYCSWLCSC